MVDERAKSGAEPIEELLGGRLQFMLDAAHDLVCVVDSSARTLWGNSAWRARFGSLAANRSDPFSLVHPDDRARLERQLRRLVEHGEPVHALEYRCKVDGGEWADLQSNVHEVPESDPPRFWVVSRDITERKRAEEALREERNRAQEYLDVAGVILLALDKQGLVTLLNRKGREVLGFENEEDLLGMEWFETCLPAASADKVRSVFKRILAGEYERFEYVDDDVRTQTGEIRTISWHTAILHDAEGNAIGTLSSGQDVTDSKRAERQNALLATAVDQADESIVITDSDATVQYVNPAFERVTGYSRAEIVGKNPRILKSGKQDRVFYEEMWNRLTKGEVWYGQMVNKRKDGSEFQEEASISPIKDARGRITNYVGVKRDITHEVELDSQLRQAHKMEAIGTLASGIAHDFNNLLQAMLGYAVLARRKTAGDKQVSASLQQVIEAGNRATELVSQILAFSRRTERRFLPVQLDQVVREAAKLLRPSLPSTIDLRVDIDPKCRAVIGDATEMHQVIMNICTNAYQAMRDTGGVLEILVHETSVDAVRASSHPLLEEGDYVRVVVVDTGCGMPPETLERVFDPYFTTKEAGEGTGLGMATVRGIVEGGGGAVTIDSVPGEGTTVEVLMPIPKWRDLPAEGTLAESGDAHGTERVLFVDDEPMLVELVRQDLQEFGYSVEARTSSVEALEAFRSDPSKFDVVITDQTMPNLTGIELSRQLLQLRPDVPVVLCTGFSDLVDDKVARKAGIRELVPKPVLCSDLAAAIRRVRD